jgi:hypothetical protein
VRTIIFSKDRAAQLHLLLESLRENDPQPLFDDIHVIYLTTNSKFEDGYQRTKSFFTYVHFHPQTNFKTDVMKLLHTCKSDLCAFFVDDIIVYRRIRFFENDVANLLCKTHSMSLACVSLRLGANTTILYQHNRQMRLPEFQEVGSFLLWNRHTAAPNENFNYPLSVDGHIFRTADIKHWGSMIYYDNPNEFEANLHLEWANHTPPLMACPPLSIVVNSPINRVQDQYRNKFGTIFSFSQEGLNDKYLEGNMIDINSIDRNTVIGSHQELEVSFR